MSRLAQRVGIVAASITVVSLLVSMYASEITRAFVHDSADAPVPLPAGVAVRYSDRLVAFIGRGATGGQATAVTLGSVILVPTSFAGLSRARQTSIIGHELIHVEQRKRYGRLYLPLYGLLYLSRGYEAHPFEREAYLKAAR